MKESEKAAKRKLAGKRYTDEYGNTAAIVVNKRGGADVDNFDATTIKDGLIRRALKLPPRTGH